MKRYILTGAPGSGKTTLLHALNRKGYDVVEEAATDVIALEQSMRFLTPWTDPLFIHKILNLQMHRTYQAHTPDVSIQFFDRSPLCTYALCIFLGYPIPSELMTEINHIITTNIFQRSVFFIENLGFIEHTDARKISFIDGLRFEQIHRDVYQHFGYTLTLVPNASVDDRLNQLIQWIS
ncbi:MAG: AAA family ATPase [Alphaproteobacteria bacterium]|nr:AAA family ATPase [Alphaproteobacteria bacterium]